MTDQKKEGIYEWKSGHLGLSFDPTKHWASGEPNGESSDCLRVYVSQLYDSDCSHHTYFGACQRRTNRKGNYLQIAGMKIINIKEWIIKLNYKPLDLEELVQHLLNSTNDIRTKLSNGAYTHFLLMVGLLCLAVVIAVLLFSTIIFLSNYLKRMLEKVTCFIQVPEPLCIILQSTGKQ